MMRQSDFGQRASKAKSVQKAEAECNQPGPTRGERGLPAAVIHNLDGDQYNAERYRSLDWRPRHADDKSPLQA